MSWPEIVPFSTLEGKTIESVVGDLGSDVITFKCTSGEIYEMYHDQDCCESVYLSDIEGDLQSLVGQVVTLAEEASSHEDPPEGFDTDWETFTWTFYKLASAKGYIDIRWFGSSNGYYSEDVNLHWVNKPEKS